MRKKVRTFVTMYFFNFFKPLTIFGNNTTYKVVLYKIVWSYWSPSSGDLRELLAIIGYR